VLARQIRPPISPGGWDVLAARLSAEVGARLIHVDLVARPNQLVRGAQARDPASEHNDFLIHGYP
jgi:hypothetical protein